MLTFFSISLLLKTLVHHLTLWGLNFHSEVSPSALASFGRSSDFRADVSSNGYGSPATVHSEWNVFHFLFSLFHLAAHLAAANNRIICPGC